MAGGVAPEIRDRLLAPCAVIDDAGDLVAVNIGAVVRRLLLFEDYILDWYGKGELAALTEVFGGDGLVTLLESGTLKLRGEAGVMGQIGQTDLMKPSGSREPLPRGTYVAASVMPSPPDRQRHISERLSEIREMQLPKRTSKAVRLAAVSALVPLPENAGIPALANLSADVEVAHHAFGVAAATELSKTLGKTIGPKEFTIAFEQVDVDTYVVETDMAARLGVDAEEEHKVAQGALLAVASVNHRIEEMASYGCVMGFTDTDLPVFDSKLNVLAAAISPET